MMSIGTIILTQGTIVEEKLTKMLEQNPERMDYQKKYQEIIADYNRDKDRTTVEDTFAKLLELANSLDEEQQRAVREGLTEEQLAVFDLIKTEGISKVDRERLKQSSRELLAALKASIGSMDQWTETEQRRATVETLIIDELYTRLPQPPFTEAEIADAASKVFGLVFQQSASNRFEARRS